MIVRMLAMLFATYDVLIVQARHLSEQRQLELSNTRGLRAVHSPPRLHELMRSHAVRSFPRPACTLCGTQTTLVKPGNCSNIWVFAPVYDIVRHSHSRQLSQVEN